MSNNILKIGLVGMDYRSMSLFRNTISQNLQGCAELVNVTTADLAVFDMDSAHAKEQWNAFKTLFPNIASIALSSNSIQRDDMTYLRKPIDFTQLASVVNQLLPEKNLNWQLTVSPESADSVALAPQASKSKKKLADQIDSALNGQDSVVPIHYNLSNIESESNIYDPKMYLYTTLKEVVKESKALKKFRKLILWNNKFLIIDPIKNTITTDMSSGVLRSVCLTAIDSENTSVEVVVTNENKIEQDTANGKTTTYSIDNLLWLMAILSARGRLPKAIDGQEFSPECPVYLLHWPNFTRLEHIPHAQNIVSLWIKQPRTISNLANSLKIEEKHVINLFVAAHAIGISGQARRPGDQLFTPSNPVKHAKRGLFASIVKKLQTISIDKTSVAYSR